MTQKFSRRKSYRFFARRSVRMKSAFMVAPFIASSRRFARETTWYRAPSRSRRGFPMTEHRRQTGVALA